MTRGEECDDGKSNDNDDDVVAGGDEGTGAVDGGLRRSECRDVVDDTRALMDSEDAQSRHVSTDVDRNVGHLNDDDDDETNADHSKARRSATMDSRDDATTMTLWQETGRRRRRHREGTTPSGGAKRWTAERRG